MNNHTDHPNSNNTDSKDLKLIKDFQKRLNDLEKNFKTVFSTINLEGLNKEIKDMNENLSNKIVNTNKEITNINEHLSKSPNYFYNYLNT